MPKSYSKKSLELRVAEYYAQLRVPKEMWKSISDLEPLLFEFEHLLKAEEYNKASSLVDEIDQDYLLRWGYYLRVIKMRENLLAKGENNYSSLYSLALAYYNIADFNKVIAYCNDALKSFSKNGDFDHLNQLFGIIGKAYRALGDNSVALEYYEKALRLTRDIGDQQGECTHLRNLGETYYYQAKYDKAIEVLQKALDMSRAIHDRDQEQRALISLGNTNYHTGHYEDSLRWLERALEIARELGAKRIELGALGAFGRVHTFLGNYEVALSYQQQGLLLAQETNSRDLEGVRYRGLALAFMGLGDMNSALDNAKTALQIAIEVKAKGREHEARAVIAQILLHLGDLDEAIQHLEIAKGYSFPPSDYQVFILEGIVRARLENHLISRKAFKNALHSLEYLSRNTKDFFVIEYSKCLSLLGMYFVGEEKRRNRYLDAAYSACNLAIQNVNKRGVVDDTIRLLDEIQIINKTIDLSSFRKLLS